MILNDLLLLRNDLKSTKIGHLSSEGLKSYLKLSVTMNKYNKEFEEKRKDLINEAMTAKGYDVKTITREQDAEISEVVIPILSEYIQQDVEIETKILSWDDLYNGILNIDENKELDFEAKTRLTEYLCTEDL